LTRANDIAKQTIASNATKYSAEQTADAQFYSSIGNVVGKTTTSGGVTSFVSDLKSAWNLITG